MRKIRIAIEEAIANSGMYKICQECGATNLKVNIKCHNCKKEGVAFFQDNPEKVKTALEDAERERVKDYGSSQVSFQLAVANEDQKETDFEDVY